MEQELYTFPKHLSIPSVLSDVRVTRSLVLCVCFVDCHSTGPRLVILLSVILLFLVLRLIYFVNCNNSVPCLLILLTFLKHLLIMLILLS